jgi:hypothetical protein
VPSLGAIVPATKLVTAHAKSKELIVVLINFIFITVISFFVLAFRDFSSLRTHFGPFTEVLRRIWWSVTEKMQKAENYGSR